MRQLVYTMHFRGQISRSSGNGTLRATSSGTSCTMQTVVGPSGAETTLHPATGDLAFVETEIHMGGNNAFEGAGSVTFGEDSEHALRFSSPKAGQISPSGVPGVLAGAVTWRIDGGEGRFASASGFISSTFTVTESGELSEYQCGLLFLPE
jgi:hypothetical protein